MMRLIRSERDGGSPMTLAQMCRALNVSRASFYRWMQPKIDRDMDIGAAMHDAALENPWYGYRPMRHELRRRGFTVNEKRVRRLMRLDNLVATRRSLRRYLISKRHGPPRYENLAKGVNLSGLNRLWIADLTYVRLRNAFIFVAIILDAFSRRCIGWAIAEHMRADLTIEA